MASVESCQPGESWIRWYAEADLSACLLGGRTITWWGRLGKILEFVAACAIVAEILGAERLRQFGEKAREALRPAALVSEIAGTFN